MLELDNISRTYTDGQSINALKNISLSIGKQEFIAIVGPSGCGKSTLLHIIGLLDRADHGEYRINHQPVSQLSAINRAMLRNQMFGFVFQSFNLLPRLSVYDNVLLPLNYRSANRQNRRGEVVSAVSRVGLQDRLTSAPTQLSGGQQQRVAIARALVGQPQVILADEPTGNLDTKTGHEIMALFQSIHQQGRTVIMVTHNNELLSYATRVIELRDGQLITDHAH